MQQAVWFSRHDPTEDQLAEIHEKGFILSHVESGKALGSVNLDDDVKVTNVIESLMTLLAAPSGAIFGVFPAPVMCQMTYYTETCIQRGDWMSGTVECYASWNVSRPAEGGKPSFTHQQWCHVGNLCNWSYKLPPQ